MHRYLRPKAFLYVFKTEDIRGAKFSQLLHHQVVRTQISLSKLQVLSLPESLYVAELNFDVESVEPRSSSIAVVEIPQQIGMVAEKDRHSQALTDVRKRI